MTSLTLPVLPPAAAAVEAEARAIVERLRAASRVGVAALLDNLDDAVLVDDVDGYVSRVWRAVAVDRR